LQLIDSSDRYAQCEDMADVMSGKNDELRLDGDVHDCSTEDVDMSRSGNSSRASWLYQCMVSECSATFERLTDLRLHFIDVHQSGNHETLTLTGNHSRHKVSGKCNLYTVRV